MNDKPNRPSLSKVSLKIPAHILAEIEIKAALAGKDRDTYLLDLARTDLSFGKATRTDKDGVIVMSPTGQIRWVNFSFCAMCGYTLGDLLGKELGTVLRGPATDAGSLEGFLAALEQKRKHLGPVLNYHKSNRPYWVCRLLKPVASAERHLGFVALERQIPTPAYLGPDGHVAQQLEARLPHVERIVSANPEHFGVHL